MNSDEEYNVASRYRTVRKHLDSLGYKQAISLDALPLIEKLLADLIQTTESLKHFKSIAQENIEACSQLQSTVDPYKCDNTRLVRECNQLHLDLIEAKEIHQKQVKDLKRDIYKLEGECNDLQLVSSRNLHRIKELEAESSRKSKKILELQGKCLKPTISNVALASKKRTCYPLRRPILESESLPKSGGKVASLPSLSNVEPKVVDLLNMADHKMNCLTHEVTKLKGELSMQSDYIHTLKNQLTTKEKEVIRLKKMLEGGRPYTAVAKDCACKKAENNFGMSNDNIEMNELRILQQAKSELEQQLKEALNKQHSAMSQALKLAERNEELEKELRDIDHIALAVEADCNSAVKENNRRVCKLQEKLEDVMTQVHVLEGELTIERREVQELRADLEACKLENRNIQRTLESTLDEKKQMTDRINELTIIEKSLNDEIERLTEENESHRQDIIQLQYANKTLKEQMHRKEYLQGVDGNDLRRVSEKGEKNDHNKASKNHRDIYSSTAPGINGREYVDVCKEREASKDSNGREYNDTVRQLCEKETELAALQQTLTQLRRERDYYRDEYNNLKDMCNKTVDKDNVDFWSRIRDLKRQLSEKENSLDELQREKKELSREKANLEMRLQTCRTEHRKSCRPCNVCKHVDPCNCSSSPTFVRDTGITKAMLERLEHERDIAQADVERLIEERDALRERLKMAAEAHTSEQRRLRENLVDVEARMKHIEKERQELLLTQGTRRATINGLEDQLDDVREELRRTKQELATQRTQYFQLRALQDQTDQALGDAQNQLTQSETELNKAMDRNRMIERQQVQLDNQAKELREEINTLRSSMTHLDHEKDQLLMVLDEKTERIAALEREIMSQEQQTIGMQQQVRELQHKNEICIDQSAEQERQLRSMQLEAENLQRQLQTASTDRENAIQENRRLQDDLAAVTCEVRNLQRELETSRAESYDLKRQLQTYVSEVRRAEELLNRKENERTEMLNHFRSLSLEATVLENNNHSLESEAAEARGALQSARDRLLDLERQLADRDCLIRGYETQISELTQNVASMETQLRQQEDQRHRAESDLTAVRDLCVKLDQQKDTLMQQLDDKDALKNQYDSQISRLKAEQGIIHDQMNRDRVTVERLETLLDQARQESINAQTSNQELQNEMSRLKQKISELQSKLSAESAELRQYQNQAAEYSKQISELRRQVTNERFDRARKEEESRRHSEGSSSTFLRQESIQDSAKAPRPETNTRPSNEWNGTATHRYFQKGKAEGYDASDGTRLQTSNGFDSLRVEYLNEGNNCSCLTERNKTRNNPYVNNINNEAQHVNLSLPSNNAMKKKRHKSPKNEKNQTEDVPEKIIPSSTNKSLSTSSNHNVFNNDTTQHESKLSRLTKIQNEGRKCNCSNELTVFNNKLEANASNVPNLNAQPFRHFTQLSNRTSQRTHAANNSAMNRFDYFKNDETFGGKALNDTTYNLKNIEKKHPDVLNSTPLEPVQLKSVLNKPQKRVGEVRVKSVNDESSSLTAPCDESCKSFCNKNYSKSFRELFLKNVSAVHENGNVDNTREDKQYYTSTPKTGLKANSWKEDSSIKNGTTSSFKDSLDNSNFHKSGLKNYESVLSELCSCTASVAPGKKTLMYKEMRNISNKAVKGICNCNLYKNSSPNFKNLKTSFNRVALDDAKSKKPDKEIVTCCVNRNNNCTNYSAVSTRNMVSDGKNETVNVRPVNWNQRDLSSYNFINRKLSFDKNIFESTKLQKDEEATCCVNRSKDSANSVLSARKHPSDKNEPMDTRSVNWNPTSINSSNVKDAKLSSAKNVLKSTQLGKEEETCCVNTNNNSPNSVLLTRKHLSDNETEQTMIKSINCTATNVTLESQKTTYCCVSEKNDNINRSLNIKNVSSASVLEMLNETLQKVEKLRDKNESKNNTQACQCERRLTEEGFHQVDTRKKLTPKKLDEDTLTSSDFTKPEFIRMLMEIKDRTKSLEEQLTIMNKNMKIKKRASDKVTSVNEPDSVLSSGKHYKDYTERKDVPTQQPGKKNVYIQKTNRKDNTPTRRLDEDTTLPPYERYAGLQITKDNVNLQKIKQNVQEIRKEELNIKNMESPPDESVTYTENSSKTLNQAGNRSESLQNSAGAHSSSTKGNTTRQQRNKEYDNLLKMCVESMQGASGTSECAKPCCSSQNNQNNESTLLLSSKRNFHADAKKEDCQSSLLSQCLECNLVQKEIKEIACCVESTSFPFDGSNIKEPLAASTPKRGSLINSGERNQCNVYCCVPRDSLREGNLGEVPKTKVDLTKLVPSVEVENVSGATSGVSNPQGKQCLICGESKTNIEFVLSKGISNVCLKSKCKRIEFTSFRPKCLVTSPTFYEQGVMKHKTRKRKMQILPNVLKQLKSVNDAVEERPHGIGKDDTNTGMEIKSEFIKNSLKDSTASNLLVTVCTQSSDIQIIAATSVSSVTLNDKVNVLEESNWRRNREGCIVS